MSAQGRPAPLDADGLDYVTVCVAGQSFGIPIQRVHDVFVTGEMTRVPLAPPEVAGLVNLRGRVITAIDLRARFGLAAQAVAEPAQGDPPAQPRAGRMAVGIEAGSEHYALLVDEVGEVLRLGAASHDDTPTHLGGRWAELSAGVHRLPDRLLVVLDVDRVLSLSPAAVAA